MTGKNEKKGFSLVELIVVVCIMAVLVAVLAPALTRYVELSRQRKDESAMSELENAVRLAMNFDPVYGEVAGGVDADNKLILTFSPSGGTVTFADAENMGAELLKEVENVVGGSCVFSSKKYSGGQYDYVVTVDMNFPYAKVTGEWSEA